jgi:hypothetical protein
MEEFAQREVAALQGMVLNWKSSHLASATPGEEWGFLADEFLEEIDMHVVPYARRLFECHYMSDSETKSLLDFCYDQVEDLRKLLEQAKS